MHLRDALLEELASLVRLGRNGHVGVAHPGKQLGGQQGLCTRDGGAHVRFGTLGCRGGQRQPHTDTEKWGDVLEHPESIREDRRPVRGWTEYSPRRLNEV